MPRAESPALSATASPIPAATPAADAARPMTSDSPRTAANTWRRLAPTARSSASSRSRWATTIENVLKMTNAPTNSAMNPNVSRKVPMKLSAWCTLCCPSAVTDWPLTTSMPGSWMAAWIRATSVSCETPGSAATSSWLTFPGWPSTWAAVAGVNAAMLAPSGLSAVPQVARPVMVYVPGLTLVRMRTLSPTLKCPTSAECLSITTWPGPRGGWPPGTSRSGLRSATLVHAMPIVGGPLDATPIGLPDLPTSWA